VAFGLLQQCPGNYVGTRFGIPYCAAYITPLTCSLGFRSVLIPATKWRHFQTSPRIMCALCENVSHCRSLSFSANLPRSVMKNSVTTAPSHFDYIQKLEIPVALGCGLFVAGLVLIGCLKLLGLRNLEGLLMDRECCCQNRLVRGLHQERTVVGRPRSPLQLLLCKGPEGLRGFQEVRFPRFRDNGTGWW